MKRDTGRGKVRGMIMVIPSLVHTTFLLLLYLADRWSGNMKSAAYDG